MTWRTVILAKEAKLSLRMEHLVITSEEVVTIPLNEINVLLIENPMITLTGHIVNALSSFKITTIICDQKMNPSSVLHAVYGHHRQAKHIQLQFNWNEDNKQILWQKIVQQKIHNQAAILLNYERGGFSALKAFQHHVILGDTTNREGHAAKVYFHELYGSDFYRSAENPLNWALNYGYAILHSLIARQIISKGYLTEVGIFHGNEYNQFNLASDLVEVFRPIVDALVYEEITDTFGKDEKRKILKVVEQKVWIQEKKQYLPQAIQYYVESCLYYLNTGSLENLHFPTLVLKKG